MKTDDKYHNDGLSAYGNFWIEFDRESKDGNFTLRIYDRGQEFYAQVEGPNFSDTLRHALHYADPLLATMAFDNYYDWNQTHNIIMKKEHNFNYEDIS